MNLVLAVEHLIPDAKYSDASNYERLQKTWADEQPLPTLTDLEQAWAEILSAREAEIEKQSRTDQLRTDAKTNAAKIPAWATMTEAEAITFIQNSVTDLASAKQVLVAMARIIVHLRDAQWPDLGEEEDARI